MSGGNPVLWVMRAARFGLIAVSLIHCGEPTEVTQVVTAPLALPPDGSLNGLAIRLPQGRSLAFVAQPLNGDETLKSDITLVSNDEGVCQVFKTQQTNQFAVIGQGVGLTTLNVLDRNGNISAPTFSVEVTAP